MQDQKNGLDGSVNHQKILIVMPAYNAEKTLEATVRSIPAELGADIILVDDSSTDDTAERARRLGLKVIKHAQNRGYGANQKTCYKNALAGEAEIVIMIHPDYQYDARLIPALIQPIELGICDVMIGNRIRSRKEAFAGGMPVYKYFANRLLTVFENFLLGQNLGEFHSGMRAYRRAVLEDLPWQRNSDGFVFDQQFLIQSIFFNYKIGDIPVPVKYFPEASSINFLNSLRYGVLTLWTLALFFMAKTGLPIPLFIKNDTHRNL